MVHISVNVVLETLLSQDLGLFISVNVVGTKIKSWGCYILPASKVIFYLLIDFIAGS